MIREPRRGRTISGPVSTRRWLVATMTRCSMLCAPGRTGRGAHARTHAHTHEQQNVNREKVRTVRKHKKMQLRLLHFYRTAQMRKVPQRSTASCVFFLDATSASLLQCYSPSSPRPTMSYSYDIRSIEHSRIPILSAIAPPATSFKFSREPLLQVNKK